MTGDYATLVDHGKDYLENPHLLFWASAASYHLFSVTSFAYKFPSFLFTILGTYSTYKLGMNDMKAPVSGKHLTKIISLSVTIFYGPLQRGVFLLMLVYFPA